jgi:hypothetical protein
MATKKTNWLLIILGIVVFVVIVGIACVVGFGYYMYRQMGISTTTSGNLEQEFADIRAPFQGQVPYIEISTDQDKTPVVHHELEKPNRTSLTRLRMAIYDERQHRIVRMQIPFWLVRLSGNKPINLQSSSGFDPGVQLTITAEDLERHGPGLVLDTTGRRGEHVLVWAE